MHGRNSETTGKRESRRSTGRLFSAACWLISSVVVVLLLSQLIFSYDASDGRYWHEHYAEYDDNPLPSEWWGVNYWATDLWNNAGASFYFEYDPNSQNKLEMEENPFAHPGITHYIDWSGDALEKVRITFDPRRNWHYDLSPPSPYRMDAPTVAAHEFGHWLVLGHSDSSDAIMDDGLQDGEYRRSLHQDDKDGIYHIYNVLHPPGGGGCSSAQSLLAGSTLNREELEVVERFGEAVLAENSVVRRYVEVLEGSREISILTSDPAIRHHAGVVIKRLVPDMQRALRKGSGMAMLLRKESVLDVDALLEHASQEASPALRNQITYVREMLRAGVGRTLGEVLPNGETTPSVLAKKASLQNWPNPFNAETTIWFRVPETGLVRLVVHNTLGQTVRTLVEEPMRAGVHSIRWDGRDDGGRAVAGGIYFYRLETEGLTQTKKMLLLR